MMEFEKASRYVKILHELYNVRALILEDLGEDANETALINELIKNVHLHLNGEEVYQPVSDFQLAIESKSNTEDNNSEENDHNFEGAVFGQDLQFDLSPQESAEVYEEISENVESETEVNDADSDDDNSFNSAIEKQKSSQETSIDETDSAIGEEETDDSYDWDVEDEEEEEESEDSGYEDSQNETEPEEEEEEEIIETPKPKIKGIRILGRKQPGDAEQSAAPESEPELEETMDTSPEPEEKPESSVEIAQSHVEEQKEPEPEPEPEPMPEPEPEPEVVKEPRNLFSFEDAETDESSSQENAGGFNPDYAEMFDQGSANEVSDRLSSSVVTDMRKAFGLNERIYYTNELFNKDKNAFEGALDVLNSLDEFDEARAYIEQKLIAEYNWDDARKRSKAKSFIRTVRRKFD